MTVKSAVRSVDTGRSFPSGGSQKVSFTKGKTKAIFVSQSGKGRVNCNIPDMRAGSMTRPDSTFQVTAGSRTWERVLEVEPGSSGDYALTCTSERQAEFAVGDRPHVGATAGATFAAIGLFFAAVAAAVAISAVTAVRRGRHRRQYAAASAASPQWGGPLPFGPPSGLPPGPLS
ncbi:serine/arginine repetitive matrix protein 2 [Streptomyces oryzae]|uniref:Serine/arginine repetitive matrix protein 2 n=1 Tax=Streptomyces oryzae TaxID=1434886 RepID=A0ABS3X4R8_9ACTN|nr:serine/arginine repetitive matrix protein 2 [Streptomyces oryzae]MBO8190338.1 serine/arginine repetitive matrix protein 2 [Streptomyces oryzae]